MVMQSAVYLFRRRAWRCAALLIAGLAANGGIAEAQQVARDAMPMSRVLLDRNQDLIPDAVGDTVHVAGRITLSSGQLHRNWTEVFLQDGSGGIKIVASSGAPVVVAGDSVEAVGRLDHELGMAQLTDPFYRIVQAPRTAMEPETVSEPDSRGLEPYEGRLIEVKGTVVARVPNEAGDNLIILTHGQMLNVFVYGNRSQPFTFEDYERGEYVRVRGIAGQFDPQPPFNASYQIFPRTADDVTLAGFSPNWYRNVAIVVVLLLLMAAGWSLMLRRQIRNRVSQLQVSESRYSHLFDAAGDSVLVHANDHTAGWIIDANATARRALGYTSEEFHTLTLRTIAGEGAVPVLEQHLFEANRRGGALHTVELKTKAGASIPFEIRTHRLDVHGKSAFLSIARDVAVRQAYEKGLIEAKRAAEEMEQLKSAFFINMSHEIRTPLTAIIGAAELLHDEVSQDQQEFTDLIEHGGKRLLHTLNDVLEFAQLDAGEVALAPRPIDLVEEIHVLIAERKADADAKSLPLELATDVGSLPLLLDQTAARRIVGNVIDNAIKFTDQGSVRITLESKRDRVHVHVSDTGVGMDEAFLPHLFTEFKQESSGFSRSHEGNGLGVAIAKRLIDLMGGSIDALSRKGVGSVITVTFPRTGLPIPTFGGDGATVQPSISPEFVKEGAIGGTER